MIQLQNSENSSKDEELLESIEDYQLGIMVKERQNEKNSAIEVDLDEL